MAKVTSNYYIGNVPVYAGNNGGAHTPNGCLYNLNIRIKPEVNNIGFTIIRTNDPIIHSYDNTTRAPEFEVDLSNLNKMITLLKYRAANTTPTMEANAFLKIGVTTLTKYADKVRSAWLKSIDNTTIIVLENNGQQEMFTIEGFFQNEYFLEVLYSTRDLYVTAKAVEENKKVDGNDQTYYPPMQQPVAPAAPMQPQPIQQSVAPAAPMQPQPAAPMQQPVAPVAPMQPQPAAPMQPQPAAPMQPQPAAPMQPQPAAPMQQQPVAPALMQQSGQPMINSAPTIPGAPNYGAPSVPTIPN